MNSIASNLMGIYEKALPESLTWKQRFLAAKEAGYDFIEISIDATDKRIERLKWTDIEKLQLKKDSLDTGIPILTMCLSANRRYPIGSEDNTIREKGVQLVKDAIDFSVDIGIRIIQLAGYDEFGRPSNAKTKQNFINSLARCARYAEKKAVMLAFETMEVELLDSVKKAKYFVEKIGSPWLNIYPDIGNLTATGQSIEEDFICGKGNVVAIHLKDTLPRIVRDIDFGCGIVEFTGFFNLLNKIKYRGLFVVEMWTDETEESYSKIKHAREFLLDKM